jgi:hypothetical protein
MGVGEGMEVAMRRRETRSTKQQRLMVKKEGGNQMGLSPSLLTGPNTARPNGGAL